MHQKGFKEILPKEPTCGLKGLLGSVMGPSWVRIIFPQYYFGKSQNYTTFTDNRLIKQ